MKAPGFQILILVHLLSLVTLSRAAFFVDPAVEFTDWSGWGTSLAWFGDILGGLPQDVQDEINSGLFSPDRLNLNILRYTIGGTTPGNLTCGPYRLGGATESFKDGPDVPYNWERDPRARKVLLAAKELGVDTFEAFSNSPPEWMTKSGCSKGNPEAGPLHDNFDPINSDMFTDYLTEVVSHYQSDWNLTFSSLAPFNEPSSGYWPGPSGGQEGCCMERSTMIQVIRSLSAALERKGMSYVTISVGDETEVNQELRTQEVFTEAGVAHLYSKVNTHGYSDNGQENRAPLYTLTQKNGHVLWMDEMGWGATPTNDMSQGIALALRVVEDLRNMNPAAWVYWQALEDQKQGAWGLVDVPFENATLENVRYNSGYFAMMQFSKYIKKGYKLIHVNDVNSVAAFDSESKTFVLVVVNSEDAMAYRSYDLNSFNLPMEILKFRTSSSEQNVNLGPVPLTGDGSIAEDFPPKSVTTFVATSATPKSVTQLIENGDFESPTKEPWSLEYGTRVDGAINGEYVYRGDFSGYLDFTESELALNQDLIAPETKQYFLSARVATNGSGTKFGVLINRVQGPEVVVEPWKGYRVFGLTFEAVIGDEIRVYLYGPEGETNAQIDDVVLH